MVNHFLRHQWLQFRRSPSFGRELGLSIFVAVMGLIVFVSFLSLAFALPKLIDKIPGVSDPILFINQVLIYFFLMELFMRYLMQKVPVMDIQSYLNLPIKRKFVAWFLIVKSLITPFNILSSILTVPFALKIIIPKMGVGPSVTWIVGIFCISLSIHFLNILFKKKLEEKPLVWVVLIALAATNYILTTYYGTDFFKPLVSGLMSMLHYPIAILVPIALLVSLIVLTVKFFRENLYIEEIADQQSSQIESYTSKLGFLSGGSISNVLLLQEIRLILRHKRTRSAIFISILFLGYGFLLFSRHGEINVTGIFIAIFMTGSFLIGYGQFFWSWNTNQMDFFFTKPVALQTWLRSRYKLLLASSLITTALSIPFAFFGWNVLLIIISCGLYNIGINIPFIVRLSLWSPKPIDLDKGAFMNYEGTGPAQFVMGFPLIVGPLIIYLPIKNFIGDTEAMLAIAFIGIIGILLQKSFLKKIERKIQKLKYKLIHDLTL